MHQHQKRLIVVVVVDCVNYVNGHQFRFVSTVLDNITSFHVLHSIFVDGNFIWRQQQQSENNVIDLLVCSYARN